VGMIAVKWAGERLDAKTRRHVPPGSANRARVKSKERKSKSVQTAAARQVGGRKEAKPGMGADKTHADAAQSLS